MANPRGTFAKRNREMKLKDRAKAKEERRAARQGEVKATKGPPIAWDEQHEVGSDSTDLPDLPGTRPQPPQDAPPAPTNPPGDSD